MVCSVIMCMDVYMYDIPEHLLTNVLGVYAYDVPTHTVSDNIQDNCSIR